MKIDTFLGPPVRLPEIKNEKTVMVMIDVLRASTSICTAIYNGAREAIPCKTIEEAWEIRKSIKHNDVLLCGERQGIKPEGFDLGNSPFEYSPAVVDGKSLIMTTTNGTAIFSLADGRPVALIGSCVNRKAVADYINNNKFDRAVFICAGTNGEFTYEDAICAVP